MTEPVQLPVWRNALAQLGPRPELSRDLEVYEAVVKAAVEKQLIRPNNDYVRNNLFCSTLKRIHECQDQIYSKLFNGASVADSLVDRYRHLVERLNGLVDGGQREKALVDELLEGQDPKQLVCGYLGKLENQFLIDVYRDEDGVWWEERGMQADVQIPADVAGTLDQVVDGDYARIEIYYAVNPHTEGLVFNYAAVEGRRVPSLVGNEIWRAWGEEILDREEERKAWEW
jgi:hypothetical protein